MSWDDRQRAMLAEMGYRLPARAAEVAAPDALALPDAEPAPVAVAERVTERVMERVVERSPAPVAPPAPAPMLAAEALRAVMPSPAGFADLDAPALRAAVAGCRACGLCEQRRHAVYGSGAEVQADWLVVTDPPDADDDAAGLALGGDAGRLLDRMLAAAGQSRLGDAPTVFVTPLVKCRPPRGRAPQPAELDACGAVLARQVELLRPRLVLAMGLQAARRLTGLTEPLGRLRGRAHSWGGLPVVVTYHPAYLLRSPADKAGAWDDLCLARRTMPAS
ncbi:uracil-DNA glycosylase [Roseateles sp. BYS96W]|uniref:Type-4 uracil-DNA glycosylase n=1 Tax=Pelomonas nitida TaxID=3299027 RepID=A0ABW7G9A2_9BURK